MIYQLGEFQFDGETSYNSLDHQKAARWDEQAIIEKYPMVSFSGLSAEKLTLTGTYYNYRARGDWVRDIGDLIETGTPLPLTGEDGTIYGNWGIVSLRRTGRIFRPNQESPIVSEWTIELIKVGADA